MKKNNKILLVLLYLLIFIISYLFLNSCNVLDFGYANTLSIYLKNDWNIFLQNYKIFFVLNLIIPFLLYLFFKLSKKNSKVNSSIVKNYYFVLIFIINTILFSFIVFENNFNFDKEYFLEKQSLIEETNMIDKQKDDLKIKFKDNILYPLLSKYIYTDLNTNSISKKHEIKEDLILLYANDNIISNYILDIYKFNKEDNKESKIGTEFVEFGKLIDENKDLILSNSKIPNEKKEKIYNYLNKIITNIESNQNLDTKQIDEDLINILKEDVSIENSKSINIYNYNSFKTIVEFEISYLSSLIDKYSEHPKKNIYLDSKRNEFINRITYYIYSLEDKQYNKLLTKDMDLLFSDYLYLIRNLDFNSNKYLEEINLFKEKYDFNDLNKHTNLILDFFI